MISLEELNKVYSKILESCHLDEAHYNQLVERGLDSEVIKKNGYISFNGFDEERKMIGELVHKLMGTKSVHVPGFFKKDDFWSNDFYWFKSAKGMVIPSRDSKGKIFNFRIRIETEKGKAYIFVSSKKNGGPSAPMKLHFPRAYRGEEELSVTEGPLKADVATALSGRLVVSTQSITSIDCLAEDLEGLKVKRVFVAFDKDLESNLSVARATAKVLRYLSILGFETGIMTWEIDEKGIDDALKAGGTLEELRNEQAREYIEKVFLKLGLRQVNWEGKHDDPIEKDYENIEWGPISDIPSGNVEPASFLKKDIPEFCRDYAIEKADLIQGPIDYFLAALITLISSLIGTKIQIQPKAKDSSWIVVPNLWGLIIGLPSSFKSPLVRLATRFLDKHISQARQIFLKELKEFKVKESSLQIKSKTIEEKLRSEYKKSELNHDLIKKFESELLEIEKDLTDSRPKEMRYLITDATPEATLKVLADNQSGVLIYRDEFAGLLHSFNKKGRETEKAMFLEGFNGNQISRTDRVGRDGESNENLCLSLLGTIQPGILDALLLKFQKEGRGDDGFLERLQLMVFPPLSKKWQYIDKEVDFTCASRIETVIDKLVEYRNKNYETLVLKFSSEAQKYFRKEIEKLNNRLRSENSENVPYLNHLGKYSSLLPSLALIFHVCSQIDKDEDFSVSQVSLEAVVLASRWCEILEQHAVKVYNTEKKLSVISANSLLEKIKTGEVRNGFPVRSIYRKGWKNLADKETVYKALKVLENANVARIKNSNNSQFLNSKSLGAKPKVIEINPEIYRS